MRPSRPLPAELEIRDHLVPSTTEGQPGVLLRSYVPTSITRPAPCVFSIHGGGFVLGSVDGDEAQAAQLAVETGCIVMSVAYRLAPEHPFPAALDDCYRALCWLVENHRELGVDADRVALHGPSAGGALAAATALVAKDHAGAAIAHLMLVSPMLDDRSAEPSTLVNTGFGAWSREANMQAWSSYLGATYGNRGADRRGSGPVQHRDRDGDDLGQRRREAGDLALHQERTVSPANDVVRPTVWREHVDVLVATDREVGIRPISIHLVDDVADLSHREVPAEALYAADAERRCGVENGRKGWSRAGTRGRSAR
jgi:acetyl esterase/lipase